jgi:hypothetical protein
MPEHGIYILAALSKKKKKFKSQLTTGKVMLTFFWVSQGTIPEHYHKQSLPRSQKKIL